MNSPRGEFIDFFTQSFPQEFAMSSNLFSDVGLIFFVSWSFVLARLSIAAFGRDLLPSRVKKALPRTLKLNQFDRL